MYRSACRSEFDRIAENVDHHLLELHDVADIVIIHLSCHLTVIGNSLGTALLTDDRIDLLQRFGKRKLFFPDGHTSGFDAAHIENVIDDPQKMLCRGSDFAQVFLYLITGRWIVHGDVV